MISYRYLIDYHFWQFNEKEKLRDKFDEATEKLVLYKEKLCWKKIQAALKIYSKNMNNE